MWAKERGLDEPYPLVWHLVDAAGAASALWDRHIGRGVRRWLAQRLDLDEDMTRQLVVELAGLHDVGKATVSFQQQWDRSRHGYVRHDWAAATVLPLLLDPRLTRAGLAASAEFMAALAVAGHHGSYPVLRRQDYTRAAKAEMTGDSDGPRWHAVRGEIVAAVHAALGGPARLPDQVPAEVVPLLTGIVIMADWLSSDTQFIVEQQRDALVDPQRRFAVARERMLDRVESAGLSAPQIPSGASVAGAWGYAPNALQTSVERDFRPRRAGLVTITAPTGVGKTEAGLVAATRLAAVSGRSGVYVALPTRSTATEARRRLRGFLDGAGVSAPVALAHGDADRVLRDADAAEASMWLQQNRHRPGLAPWSTGTIDTVLRAVLRAQWQPLRLTGLANSVLLVDEVHSVDPYMAGLLARLLEWCGFLGVPVVAMSATLPAHLHVALERAYLSGAGVDVDGVGVQRPAYPGWSFVDTAGERSLPGDHAVGEMASLGGRTLHVHTSTEFPDVALWAGEGASVVVVCNTVAEAQQAYRRVRDAVPAAMPVTLLHARMPGWQRSAATEDVLTRFGRESGPANRGGVVVATQLVEQALDLDADVMVSSLAPMALLLQRAGRLHRHDRPRPTDHETPRLWVHTPVPQPPEWEAVYDRFELEATAALLDRRESIDVPGEVDELVQQVHHRSPTLLSEAGAAARHNRAAEDQATAETAAIPRPRMVDQLHQLTSLETPEVALTRLGVDTDLVVPRYTDEHGHQWLRHGPQEWMPWPDGRPKKRVVQDALVDAALPVAVQHTRPLGDPPSTWSRYGPLASARVLDVGSGRGGLDLDDELGLVTSTGRKDTP
ncbi:CRISPR-associated helicase Cas3' [Prauserella alba]|uniref:CRISPR-associated helicase Cas3' n=1 Tax=Prauserella alba TaxID=176898 RepID=UPI0027E3214E|nr:CRISPR-associated helicase Cas3' [Prauserella alba]MCP2182195.1 CRISPR-associated endonuclease/helicase Cas3 [Prauserella alba]